MIRTILTIEEALSLLKDNGYEKESISIYEGYCASKHPFFNTKPEYLTYDESVIQTKIKAVFYSSLKNRSKYYPIKDNIVINYSLVYKSWVCLKF